VILTTTEEIDLWMTAPAADALKLQRPLPDDALVIVARGGKKDEGEVGRTSTAGSVSDPGAKQPSFFDR
jgi:putative SOS response-associated peptidase YedK